MCGASQEQKNLEKSQASFYDELQKQHAIEFSQNQEILQTLQSTLSPIVNAGPSQTGYSPTELAALNTQATESTAAGYRNAATAEAEANAARGGGNAFLPSAAQEQIQAGLRSSATNQLSTLQNKILTDDYATGRLNFNNAVGELSGVPGAVENPLAGLTNATTGAGSAAASEANAINAASNSWMGLLGGVASTAVGGLTGGFGKIGVNNGGSSSVEGDF
jgi:hypothetical protein